MLPSRWQAIALLVLGVATMLGSALAFYRRSGWATHDLEITAAGPVAALPGASTSAPSSGLLVHIIGEVRKPGVLRLPTGARGMDAVREAGGPTPQADLDAINLAAPLQDGEQLRIPPKGAGPVTSVVAPGVADAAAVARAQPTAAPSSRGTGPSKLSKPGRDSVPINSASAEELQRLPGIGPAMADRILQYRRENGRFTAVEQLMEVSGIGPKKFDKMKPFVRL